MGSEDRDSGPDYEEVSLGEETTEGPCSDHPKEGSNNRLTRSRTKREAPNIAKVDNLSIWKCAVCQGTIRGDCHKRRVHIQVHEKLKISCPVAGCSAKLSEDILPGHFTWIHKMTRSSLPPEGEADLQRQEDENNQKAMECERKYFPPSSLVSFVETSARKEVEVSTSCKKCGKNRLRLYERRDHVGIHIKATIPCPFRDCVYSGRVMTITAHLHCKHGKSLQKISKEQRDRFEAFRRKFYEQVDAVMAEYFS
uniref:C2H2-type domain-containing protein n=1 Tax=Steinernema glaseri TaxID=37863 RepID=A0A1I8AB73_9BILA